MSCRYEIKDGVLTEVERNPAVNMGLGSMLSDFLTWGADTYPAERYGLIFGTTAAERSTACVSISNSTTIL